MMAWIVGISLFSLAVIVIASVVIPKPRLPDRNPDYTDVNMSICYRLPGATSAVAPYPAGQLTTSLTSFSMSLNAESALKALDNSEAWYDPKASEVYVAEFTNVASSIEKAITCATLLNTALVDETAISEQYYRDLYIATIEFDLSVAGLALSIAGIVAGPVAIAGAVVSAVGLVFSGISLHNVEDVSPTLTELAFDEVWPKPRFANY